MALIQLAGVPSRGRGEMQIRRGEEEGRCWSTMATRQGIPGLAGNTRTLERGMG